MTIQRYGKYFCKSKTTFEGLEGGYNYTKGLDGGKTF